MLKRLMIRPPRRRWWPALRCAVAGAEFAEGSAGPETRADAAGCRREVGFVPSRRRPVARHKFKGTDVIGPNNAKIGDVNDVLFDQGGRIEAYRVGVGGFLGIGAKNVALDTAAFQVEPATTARTVKLKLAMTRTNQERASSSRRRLRVRLRRPAWRRRDGSGDPAGPLMRWA